MRLFSQRNAGRRLRPFIRDCHGIVGTVRHDKRHIITSYEQALFGIDKLSIARSETPVVTHTEQTPLPGLTVSTGSSRTDERNTAK